MILLIQILCLSLAFYLIYKYISSHSCKHKDEILFKVYFKDNGSFKEIRVCKVCKKRRIIEGNVN